MNKEQILPELKKYLAEHQRSIDEITLWIGEQNISKTDLIFALLYNDGINHQLKILLAGILKSNDLTPYHKGAIKELLEYPTDDELSEIIRTGKFDKGTEKQASEK